MAWTNEIRDAIYASPSGREFTFHYGELKSDTDLKTATFTFPEKDGALVTPLGVGGRRFPMSCSFYGADCFSLADAFEEGLKERGYGELQHPIYGNHKVVPTGSISRSDNLVNGLNVSTVEITFAETIIDETFPQSKTITEDLIRNKVSQSFESIAAEAGKDLKFSTTAEKINAQVMQKTIYKKIVENISGIAKKSKTAWTEFQSVCAETEKKINSFAYASADAVSGCLTLLKIPSEVVVKPMIKIEAYGTLVADIITSFKNNPAGINNVRNQFVLTKAALEGIGVALSSGVAISTTGGAETENEINNSSRTAGATFVLNSGTSENSGAFRSRNEAVNAAAEIAEKYDALCEYIDARVGEDFVVDTGEGYNEMRDAVSAALSFIVNESFNLDIRKTIILNRDRQIMELLSELYGNFDNLDEFIIDNNLTADEIGLLPMGREVSYYV